MDHALLHQLLEETIDLAVESEASKSVVDFTECIAQYLPADILLTLEEIYGSQDFLNDIWDERFSVKEPTAENDNDLIPDGCCLVCEHERRLTRHHLHPREVHNRLIKKGYDVNKLNETINICRMCHSCIHRFFTNDQLAAEYNTLELLLADERYQKYAQWASKQRKQFRH